MRFISIGMAICALPWVGAAQQMTYRLQNAATAVEANEMLAAVRTISDANSTLDAATRVISLEGKADDLRLAEWVLQQLDGIRDLTTTGFAPIAITERDEVQLTRIFHVPGSKNAQEFNERQTALRTITDTRRLFPLTNRRLIVVRGTPRQLDLIEWLLTEFDSTVNSKEYIFTQGGDVGENTVRVFRYWRGTTQDFNGAQTLIRTLTSIRRLFPSAGQHAFVVRGTPSAVEFAGWLVEQLSQQLPKQQAGASAAHAFRLQVNRDEEVDLVGTLFYFPDSMSEAAFRAKGDELKEGVRNSFPFPDARVVGVVGTAEQVARAKVLAAQ